MSNRRFETSRQQEHWQRTLGPRAAVASLILIGLILGVGAALYYAWILEPVVFTEASPARMSEASKAEYILLVSQSYAVDGDWEKVEERLAALDDRGSYVIDERRDGMFTSERAEEAQMTGYSTIVIVRDLVEEAAYNELLGPGWRDC